MRFLNRAEVEQTGRVGVKVHEPDDEDFVLCRALNSFWLYCEKDDEAFTPHMKSDGFWEAWITAWASQQLDEHDWFIDIGANVGYYTMMAADHGMKVAAFEPIPSVYQLLISSIALNNFNQRIGAYQMAVGNERKKVGITVPEKHSGGASITEGDEIEMIPLDKLNLEGSRVLIKCDAEGAEPLIWDGMQDFLSRNKVTMFLEWDSRRYDAQTFADKLYQHNVTLLNDRGGENFVRKPDLVACQDMITIIVRN